MSDCILKLDSAPVTFRMKPKYYSFFMKIINIYNVQHTNAHYIQYKQFFYKLYMYYNQDLRGKSEKIIKGILFEST